jgi:thiol:disulfide interchange protein
MRPWCLNVIRTEAARHCRAGLLLLATALISAPLAAQPSGLFGDSRPQFLDVDAAFAFYTSLDASDTVSVHWTIAPDYYLYQDKFGFSLVGSDGSTRELAVALPDGSSHHDEFFGDVEVYYNSLTTTIQLPDESQDQHYRLQIQYQGCAEAGLCYPPQTRLLEISP